MDVDTPRNAFILANPNDKQHVLLLTCKPQEAFSSSHDVMMFYGGFDPPAIVFKSKKPTRFLAFLYPADDFEKLKAELGSIDYTPSSATIKAV